MSESLTISDRGAIRHLQMTGVPRRGNPLSRALTLELRDAVRAAEADDQVSVIVLSGTETHFSVGADLKELHLMSAAGAVLAGWLGEFDQLAQAAKPMIAAIRGHAVGGGLELALACDMIVCADDASLSLPETGIGLIAGQGGSQRLIQLAGRAVAADMILTGRIVGGAEAVALGIAARSAPAERLVDEAHAVAERIAARSPAAIRFAREVLREAGEGHLRQSMRIERPSGRPCSRHRRTQASRRRVSGETGFLRGDASRFAHTDAHSSAVLQ